MATKRDPQQLAFARRLRREQTQAESLLWSRLRNRQLEDLKFRRQQPIGPYVADFVSFEARLVVEVDGGQHASEMERRSDDNRVGWLRQRGYNVLRFWNNEVLSNTEGVLQVIREALRGAHPHPDPLPSREREKSSLPLREGVRGRGQ